jgi:hypothetical protein
MDELRRLMLEERRRTDWLVWQVSHLASALARTERRLTAMEGRHGPASTPDPCLSWTPAQWLKVATGLVLPLAALLLALSGNIDAARRLLAP